MSKPAKFSAGDRVRVTGKDTCVPYGTVLTVDKVHEGADPKWRRWYYTGEGFASGIWQQDLESAEPKQDPIIAKLDRIIELLEQQRPPYAAPFYPIPLWRPYPHYPYSPNWVTSTGSGSVQGGPPTTSYNSTATEAQHRAFGQALANANPNATIMDPRTGNRVVPESVDVPIGDESS